MRKDDRAKPTIYDVAEHANVSISTVSRVVNNAQNVADETRESVWTAIEELRFRPSRTAKALAQQSTRTIAVAVPTFTTPFHNELLKGVRSRLKDVDIDLLLCDLKWAAPEATLMKFLRRGTIDGLLLAGLTVDEHLGEELKQLGAPVVLVGSGWGDMDSFYWDEATGVHLAVNHLVEQGHRHIGMVTPSLESPMCNARIRGFKEALRRAGLEPREAHVAAGRTEKHAGFSEESGYEAMQDLLEAAPPRVTAVFASSDVQAIGAWQAIRHAGLRVPEDVALVGYDDIKVSRFIGLSSVAQNMHDVGEQAADRLLRRIQGRAFEAASQRVVPTLKVRKTS